MILEMAVNKVCVVLGVGPGLGLAVAKKWAVEGFKVAACCRNLDKAKSYENVHGNITGFSLDVTDESAVKETVKNIETSLGPIHALVYNAGSGVWKTYDKISVSEFNKCMSINATGLLMAAQQVTPFMLERGSGVIAITGATASWRGKPFTAGFAPAKGAQRMLAQSLARDLGPKNIHVFYAIVDGGIGKKDGMVDPDEIAQTYWDIAKQPKSCWTFEFEVRPSVENW